jgi:hypothetical protein
MTHLRLVWPDGVVSEVPSDAIADTAIDTLDPQSDLSGFRWPVPPRPPVNLAGLHPTCRVRADQLSAVAWAAACQHLGTLYAPAASQHAIALAHLRPDLLVRRNDAEWAAGIIWRLVEEYDMAAKSWCAFQPNRFSAELGFPRRSLAAMSRLLGELNVPRDSVLANYGSDDGGSDDDMADDGW